MQLFFFVWGVNLHIQTTRQQHLTTTETERDRDSRQRQREKRREKREERREKREERRDSSRFILGFSASWPVNSFLISANYLFYAVAVFKIYLFFGYAVTVSKFSELFNYAATVFFFPEFILHKYSVGG